MLHDFPVRGQPHPLGCLPTCVWTVLLSYGERVTYDDVSEWCRELPAGGCFWSDAIPGLVGQGYDVEEMIVNEDDALTTLRNVVEERLPVIVELEIVDGGPGHAVVIIGLDNEVSPVSPTESVTYMDPGYGEYGDVKSATVPDFLKRWQARDFQAFYILRE